MSCEFLEDIYEGLDAIDRIEESEKYEKLVKKKLKLSKEWKEQWGEEGMRAFSQIEELQFEVEAEIRKMMFIYGVETGCKLSKVAMQSEGI